MLNNVTVIIPHYNNGLQIQRSYTSVMSQIRLPKEIIIVDDHSYDTTILDSISKNHDKDSLVKLKIIKLKKNRGPSNARNIGVELSTSSYIAFLDADDIWHPQKLEICLDIMLEKDLNFLYHLYIPIGKNDNKCTYKKSEIKVKAKKRILFAFKSYISTPTVLMHKSTFSGFPLDIHRCEDYCCWLSSVSDNKLYYVDLPLASGFKNSLGDSGLSGDIKMMHTGFLESIYYLKKEKYISNTFFRLAYLMETIKFPLRHLR